jgi:hypothetical protein
MGALPFRRRPCSVTCRRQLIGVCFLAAARVDTRRHKLSPADCPSAGLPLSERPRLVYGFLSGLHGEPHLLVITRVIAAFSEHMDRGSHHVTRALFEQTSTRCCTTGNSPPMSARCPRLQLGHERSRRDGIIVPDCATAGRAVEGEGIARSEGPIHRHLQDSRR